MTKKDGKLLYVALGERLAELPASKNEVTLTLAQIGELIGQPVAKSAYDQDWWNPKKNGKPGPRRKHWVDNGFKAKLNKADKTVTFTRFKPLLSEPAYNAAEAQSAAEDALLAGIQSSGTPPLGNDKPQSKKTKVIRYERDKEVVKHVLERSRDTCERCASTPFMKENGRPGLHVHHIQTLAEGGPDTTDNTIALCPNCHSEAHLGKDKAELAKQLKTTVDAKSKIQK